MKSDIAGLFTQLGTSVPFVTKERGSGADNGWEDSKLMARLGLCQPKWQQSIIPSVSFTLRGLEPELQWWC